ncbi:hypothetical protein RRG08_009973 [Elysia crispata]|uniref:Reverse transcriptase domain-containing protein n=1 Tax=Elysia crispata TaxID=231223 RepID=A0AAE1B4F5_9GAST|nr:hypothetical protein RRG08_009973 [Elysia crispata]
MRFSTNSYITDWINLEIGIAMGCTISTVLFVMAMEVILKAAEDSAGPANLGSGCYKSPLKAFMDDTTIICSNEDETRQMLERLDVLMAWCRMKFKPKKSRSLSVKKGKVDATMTFTEANQQISTEICSTTVEAVEIKINKFTRRWLGLPPGVTGVAMYCCKAKLRLPLKSILEEYKCGKARLLSMLEDSEDPVVKTDHKDGMEEAHIYKREKYLTLKKELEDAGYGDARWGWCQRIHRVISLRPSD